AVLADFSDGGNLCSGAAQECFLEAFHLFRHDRALDDLDAATLGKADDRATGDTVEEAIRSRRVNLAVLDEEHVRARCFGNLAAPVEHESIGIALLLCSMLGQRADHVEASSLGLRRRSAWIRAAVLSDIETDTLEALLGIEVARPLPDRDRQIDAIALSGDAHHL